MPTCTTLRQEGVARTIEQWYLGGVNHACAALVLANTVGHDGGGLGGDRCFCGAFRGSDSGCSEYLSGQTGGMAR